MNWWVCFIGAAVVFGLILLTRAVLCRQNGRKLTEKQECATKEKQEYYGKRLSEMIVCETISRKNEFQQEEFLKLREVVGKLFPKVTELAEIRYFSDDCYLYKLAGTDGEKNVMLMSHHDVVEAQGEWKYPPFSGQIAEDCVWGRGTVDTKTPLFAEFTALEEMLEEGWIPPCNIYLVSSHNEEIAGDGVPSVLKWLQEEKITFDWILDEGGAVVDPPMSLLQCKCAMLAVHEKGRYTLRIKAPETPGHKGLTNKVKTPSTRMARFISRIDERPPFIRRMYPEVVAMFEAFAPQMKLPGRMIFANMWCFGGLLKRLIPCLSSQAGSMLGTTCTFKNLQTLENGDCTAEVFFRCVTEEDLKKDLETFRRIAEEYQIEFDEILADEFHRPADINGKGYHFIKECVESYYNYAACAPFILPAGTDARHFADLSDGVIRFAPIDINSQQYASVHCNDENISLDAIARCVGFYKEVLKKL